MKLNEIIQSTIHTSTPLTPFDVGKQSTNFYMNNAKTNFDRGIYSYVEPSNIPFEVKKKSIIAKSDVDDPFFKFATFLMDADLMNTNPFFPRIYNIKTEKDENGLRIYDATIEKLQPLSVMSERMQTVMRNMLVDIKLLKHSKDSRVIIFDDVKYHQTVGGVKSEPLAMLIEVIRLILLYADNLFKYIKNDELIDALKNILKFYSANANSVAFDIHADNFMVRQGGTGYQLVINDPMKAL